MILIVILTALAAVLAVALLALRSAPRDSNSIITLSGSFPPLLRGHMTFLEPLMDYLEQYYSAAFAAP